VSDAQSLAHAERVVTDVPFRLCRSKADALQHLVDATVRQPHHLRTDLQDLAARAARVLCGSIQEHPDMKAGVWNLCIRMTADLGRFLVGG
jgi:hypothetical protein